MDQFKMDLLQLAKNFLGFAIVMVLGILLSRLLFFLIKKILKKSRIDHTAKTFIFSLIRIIVYAAVVLTALGTANVDVSSIVTALGAAALTAGLAFQDTLRNLISGIILLSDKPFTAGDLIEFEGYTGYVDSVRVFSTTIHTFENKIVKIPNSKLTSNCVSNCSAGENRRIDLKFTVSYDDNLTKVKSVIYDVISKNDLIIAEPEPKVYISSHLDSGVEITVFVWAYHENYYDVLFYMQENVKTAFDENKITIPYPHVVVSGQNDSDSKKK